MPTYHYACSSCRHEFDRYQSFTEDALSVCPSCEGFIRRVIQPVGVVFKGSGWYLTDSRKPEKSESGSPTAKDTTADSSKDTTADSSKDTGDKAAAKSDAVKPEAAAKKADAAPAPKSVESKSTPTAAS